MERTAFVWETLTVLFAASTPAHQGNQSVAIASNAPGTQIVAIVVWKLLKPPRDSSIRMYNDQFTLKHLIDGLD